MDIENQGLHRKISEKCYDFWLARPLLILYVWLLLMLLMSVWISETFRAPG